MGLRETINEKPAIGYAIGAIAVLLLGYVLFGAFTGGGPKLSGETEFFTADDGATFFLDSRDNFAPYTREGQTAVRAHVFECDGTQFVGYLERYEAGVREELAAYPTVQEIPMGLMMRADMQGKELKRPGPDGEWVGSGNQGEQTRIMNVTCPDGNPARPIFP